MYLTAYALPALVALLVKAFVFFYARYSKVQNLQTRLFLLFLFGMSVQNLAEIRFFLTYGSGQLHADFAGRLWYAAAIFSLPFLLHLALLSGKGSYGLTRTAANIAIVTIYVPAIALEALLWNTRLLISYFEPMSYTVTQVPGPLYFLFQLFVVTYLCTTIGLLIHGACTADSTLRRQQSKWLLIGLVPFVCLAIAILALRQLGFRSFNATATLPVMVTFLLAVTAYATHQYRLFDIEFFIPWSKVRRRKTEFYKRIQATIAAIAELRSVQEVTDMIASTLRCQVALVGAPQPIAAMAEGQNGRHQQLLLSEFPHKTLKHIEHIVVAQEVAEIDPLLYETMARYKVGAIVPFNSHTTIRRHWLLLGDHFSNEIYTPLDFKVVEGLFAAIAERFLDDFLQVRSRLRDIQAQLRRSTRALGMAWHKEHEAKREFDALRAENSVLRDEISSLRQSSARTELSEPPRTDVQEQLTLETYLTKCEKEAVASALDRYGGNKTNAASYLGIDVHSLEYLLERHRLDRKG